MDLNYQYQAHQRLIMAAAASDCAQDRQRKLALARSCAAHIAAYQRHERAPAAADWAQSITLGTPMVAALSEYAA